VHVEDDGHVEGSCGVKKRIHLGKIAVRHPFVGEGQADGIESEAVQML
jgi:hypothetical protein